MQRVPVSSSNLKSVGYESGILEIEFHGSGIYQYSHVPQSVYEGLMGATSKGTFFNQYIKQGPYTCVKIK